MNLRRTLRLRQHTCSSLALTVLTYARYKMPPKGSASSVSMKRKAYMSSITAPDHNDSESEAPLEESRGTSVRSQRQCQSQTRKKRAKLAPNLEESVNAGAQPRNKLLPPEILFPSKKDGALRIAAWNVAGLAASQKKGFKYYVEAENPDILILTETKVNNEPADPELAARFPYRYWSIAEKKGYSGTAILSKHKPLSTTKTLPGHPDDTVVRGRILTLEFEKFWLVGTYVVNAGQGLKTLDVKNEWNRHFEAYIQELDKTKPVIWAGDLNVAPTAKDLTNAKKNWNKTAGYTEAETRAFARILDPSSTSSSDGPNTLERRASRKFVDVWRHLHPDEQHYSYFSYRFNCREKGIGWRIDMFVLSERLVENVQTCEIRSEIYGASDHCPVVMEISDVL